MKEQSSCLSMLLLRCHWVVSGFRWRQQGGYKEQTIPIGIQWVHASQSQRTYLSTYHSLPTTCFDLKLEVISTWLCMCGASVRKICDFWKTLNVLLGKKSSEWKTWKKRWVAQASSRAGPHLQLLKILRCRNTTAKLAESCPGKNANNVCCFVK